jgi:hypothetical protein
MRYTLWFAMSLSLVIVPLPTMARAADAPSRGQDPGAHTTFTWRAWADSEYLADRDAGIDATRQCTKAQGQVVGQESLGTRMLGNGTWQATTRVTCLTN